MSLTLPTSRHLPRSAGWELFLLLLAVVTVLRLIYLAFVPLELSPDEAYYWDWSRQLDLCYYSKPPLIAWLMAGATGLAGISEWGVRFPAVLLGTGTLLLIFATAQRLFGGRSGWVAALLFLLAPANAVLNLLLTIDPPMLFCWAGAMWATAHALFPDEGQGASGRKGKGLGAEGSEAWAWWFLGGLFTAVGILGKQTMLGLPAITLLFLMLSRKHRGSIVKGYLLFGFTGALSFIPILWWNAQNDWITFQHTTDHFGGEGWNLPDALGDFAGYLGAQAGLLSPVTFGLILLVMGKVLTRHFTLGPRERWLALLGPVPLTVILVLALTQRVQPNWPAPFFIASLILLGGWLGGKANLGRKEVSRRWLPLGLTLGGVLMLTTMAAPLLQDALGKRGIDPTVRLRGWEELAQEVQAYRDSFPPGEAAFILCDTRRQPVSALAFYLEDHPRVYRWNRAGVIDSQHELWEGPVGYLGQDGLVISHSPPETLPPTLESAFARFTHLGEVRITLMENRIRVYHLYAGEGFQTWPIAPSGGNE